MHTQQILLWILRPTGPTKSGMKSSRSITLARMQKKPRSVTMFGASHNGRSLTKPFHYVTLQLSRNKAEMQWSRAYIVFENVPRDQGFVDARVFVRLKMDESVLRHTFMGGGTYRS